MSRAGVPDGWVLVPREPTPKMIDATWNDPAEAANGGGIESHNARNRRIYAAMLSASPQPVAEHCTCPSHTHSLPGQCAVHPVDEDVQPSPGAATDALIEAASAAANTLQHLCDTRLRGQECADVRSVYHQLRDALSARSDERIYAAHWKSQCEALQLALDARDRADARSVQGEAKPVACAICHGLGYHDDGYEDDDGRRYSAPVTCDACNGTGHATTPQPAVVGWMPIETAPKDGTTVLAYRPSGAGFVARQDVVPVHWSGWGSGEWVNSTSGHKVFDALTDWQPYPAAPTIAKVTK